MSLTNSGSIDSAVAASLAEYDGNRNLGDLQEAGDLAARYDGELLTDPVEAHARGAQRLANWAAIFARFKRDLDPAFDPEEPPLIRIAPPGPEGQKYMPGVDPKFVKDPVLREKYIEAIAKNRELIRAYSFLSKLNDLHEVILEKAEDSVADAVESLGLEPEEIVAILQSADLRPSDQQALIAAANREAN
ncbi:MAG TPA: hypothetical protein VKI44_03540 [Acetobacteraceae bacterium]|nr:hypothetical protein [Acetobacteraceae bacterium]